ncbi:hypothetical protein GIB67_004961 [Kingdonia uniflora]|uniref:Uncharacterized protein n=1 Tax=Kingdonia uniflora TaxID=39325 RepID=A0A7J7NMJ1_9MAGN|nr:hypothetical protein GIB67_004961 [Kingdonia uniflora]
MAEFGGLKRSYYVDPQPRPNYEWHLFEYKIHNCDAFALYRLKFKNIERKKSPKVKVTNDPISDLKKQMGRLTAVPIVNKRSVKGRTKAIPKGRAGVNTYSAPNVVASFNMNFFLIGESYINNQKGLQKRYRRPVEISATIEARNQLKKNGTQSSIVSKEVTTKVNPKRILESTPLQDNSDQEILSSILKKRSKKRISKAQNEIQMTTSIKDIRAGVSEDVVQSPEEDAGLSDKNIMLDLSDKDGNAKDDQVTSTSIGKQVDELLINNADQNPYQQIRDELEDSGNEFEPIAPKIMVQSRKSKMVIDF